MVVVAGRGARRVAQEPLAGGEGLGKRVGGQLGKVASDHLLEVVSRVPPSADRPSQRVAGVEQHAPDHRRLLAGGPDGFPQRRLHPLLCVDSTGGHPTERAPEGAAYFLFFVVVVVVAGGFVVVVEEGGIVVVVEGGFVVDVVGMVVEVVVSRMVVDVVDAGMVVDVVVVSRMTVEVVVGPTVVDVVEIGALVVVVDPPAGRLKMPRSAKDWLSTVAPVLESPASRFRTVA